MSDKQRDLMLRIAVAWLWGVTVLVVVQGRQIHELLGR